MNTISKIELKLRLEHFKQIIHHHQLALTPQKLAIFRVLAASTQHPDPQEIYRQVKKDFPNISLATVYQNLKKFAALGLALEIATAGETAHYDARIETHQHIIDTQSGQISDLELSPQLNLLDKIKGKKVKKIQITYYI